MCQRNSVMITLFVKITAFHGRLRCNHRVRRSRSSITSPMVQIPTAR